MPYVILIAVLAAGDLALKYLIEKQDASRFPRPMPHTGGKIWLYRNHNEGFPFGFLKRYGGLVRTVPLVIISGLGGVLCYLLPKKGNAVQKTALALLLGGALSNLYDRYVRRYVVDYFSIRIGVLKKVVFNLGDMLVFLGSGILLCRDLILELRGCGAKGNSRIPKQVPKQAE